MIDLLLVNAPSKNEIYGKLAALSAIEPPVWAGLIARYCLNHGWNVEILDAEAEGLTAGETAARVVEARPRLTAFCIYGHQPSASTQCLPVASAVCRAAKERANDEGLKLHTLALGTHPSALPERTLCEEPFDFVCQGEGHKTIEELIKSLSSAGSKPMLPEVQFAGIRGLWYKGAAFRPIAAENAADLDVELQEPPWELLPMGRYRAHNWHLWTSQHAVIHRDGVQTGHPLPLSGGYASVQTSLGCVFACQFCCIQAPFGDANPRMRYWSPENVAHQFTELVSRYGITNFKVADEMFCLNRAHVKAICKLLIPLNLSIGENLNIWAYARVDTVKDEEMLALLREAGFRWLGIGIESGSKHVRDGVEKGRFGNEQIIEAVRRVERHGIHVAANYIFGLPNDTRESCRETFELALEVNAPMANFYCAMAYPGSALHRIAEERGWRLPEAPGGPGWIGYSQHAPDSMPLRTEALSSEELLDIRDEAWMRYFTRAEYLAMMRVKFGDAVVAQIEHMTSFGKPKRNHREEI